MTEVASREGDWAGERLTAYEQQRLNQLEKQIAGNFRSFVEVGLALAEIRERKLYREHYRTFEAYTKKIFDLASRTAYQYIAASEAYENVRNCAQNEDEVIEMLPVNEAQVRPLTKLSATQQLLVWKAAVETAPRGKVTAAHVNKVVKRYIGDSAASTITNRQAKPAGGRHINPELKGSYEAFLEQVKMVIEEGYKTTSRANLISLLDDLIAIREVVALGSDLEELRGFDGGSADANKLEKDGYRLFRMDRSSMNIKERAGGGWPKHSGPYRTVVEMETAFAELMKDVKSLRG